MKQTTFWPQSLKFIVEWSTVCPIDCSLKTQLCLFFAPFSFATTISGLNKTNDDSKCSTQRGQKFLSVALEQSAISYYKFAFEQVM